MGVVQSFHEGGIFMYFILLFGVLTLAFITERFVSLFIKIKSPPQNFRNQLLEYIKKGDYAGAEKFAKQSGEGSSLARVAELGCQMRASAAGEEALQSRMDEKLSHEVSVLERRTGFLAMFGNVATLLGLLGTITGMIHSFSAVASANPSDRAILLSRGISEAMNCTAFGLIVAIPALVAYAVFQNRTDRLINAISEGATQIYNDLMFLAEKSRA